MLMVTVFLRSGLPKFAAARPPHTGPSSATLLGPRPQNTIHIVVWATPSLEIRLERCPKKGLHGPPPEGTVFRPSVPKGGSPGGPLKSSNGSSKVFKREPQALLNPFQAF